MARVPDATAASPAHDGTVNPTLPVSPAVVHRHGQVVVLVEDDSGLRAALERVLNASGFEARAYDSAEAVLSERDGIHADCLVVDLNLPSMSGLDLIARLRSLGVTVPVIIITAQDDARVRDEVRRCGVDHFLAKPFLGSALVRFVDAIVAQRAGGTGTPSGAGSLSGSVSGSKNIMKA
jgi:FixJ family two-component response regulator